MIATLKKPSYDEASTAIRDTPAVKQAKAALDAAQKGYEALKQQVDEYDRLAAPALDSSNSPVTPANRLKATHAQLALPESRLKLVEAEMALEEAIAVHQKAVRQATELLNGARIEPRKEKIAQLFYALREAQEIANDIQAYDEKTVELGGTAPLAPLAELVGDQFRPDLVSFNAERLAREGWFEAGF